MLPHHSAYRIESSEGRQSGDNKLGTHPPEPTRVSTLNSTEKTLGDHASEDKTTGHPAVQIGPHWHLICNGAAATTAPSPTRSTSLEATISHRRATATASSTSGFSLPSFSQWPDARSYVLFSPFSDDS